MKKVDASQFFKCASVRRGVLRTRQLFNRIRCKTGKTGVAVAINKACDGFLCAKDCGKTTTHKYISFASIMKHLEFIASEDMFAVGDMIVQRREGWPMGGSLSEPGTLVDLQHDILVASIDMHTRTRVGWQFRDFTFNETITGVQHVDDCLMFSKILCPQCMLDGLAKLWPEDVGCTDEGGDCCVQMLNSFVLIRSDKVFVFPHNPNVPYAMNLTDHQTISRLGPFFSLPTQHRNRLKMFLFAQLLSYNYVVQGSDDEAYIHIVWFLFEIIRLKWPLMMLSKVIRSIPRKHYSPFISLCLRIGKHINKAHDQIHLLDSCDLQPDVEQHMKRMFVDLSNDPIVAQPIALVDGSLVPCSPSLASSVAQMGYDNRGKGKGKDFWNGGDSGYASDSKAGFHKGYGKGYGKRNSYTGSYGSLSSEDMKTLKRAADSIKAQEEAKAKDEANAQVKATVIDSIREIFGGNPSQSSGDRNSILCFFRNVFDLSPGNSATCVFAQS